MKYLNKTSVDNYYNILFSPDKNDVNVILLNETNKSIMMIMMFI